MNLQHRNLACLSILPRLALAGAVLTVSACNREAAPSYAPSTEPYQPALVPPPAPAVPSGEQISIARACAGDIERFCAGVPPRQGDIKQCMKAHVTELSAGCFDTVMGAIASQQAP